MTWIFNLVLAMSVFKTQDIDSLRMEFPRVEQAAVNTHGILQEMCAQKGLVLPLNKMFIRIFKEEKIMEIWGANDGDWQLIKSYPVCTLPGKLGPKVRQGDRQVPEGWYQIDSINPVSSFHLSVRINYPNTADLVRSRNEKDPGGDIFIHGDCYSVGCIPIEDAPMEEVFWLTVQSLYAFKDQPVPVLVLPFYLSEEEKYAKYIKQFPEHKILWEELKSIDLYFEELKDLPEVYVDEEGHYQIQY